MYYLGIILQLASLVAAILVLVKLFQTKGALHGILGLICGLYTFIWGWMHAGDLKLKNLMIIWTVGMLLGYGLMFPTIMKQTQETMKQLEQMQPAPTN
jgi:Flp pilus assembly protein protease CpaA